MSAIDSLLQNLSNKSLLNRDEALRAIDKSIGDHGFTETERSELESGVIKMLDSEVWEERHGSFCAAAVLSKCRSVVNDDNVPILKEGTFDASVLDACKHHLEDPEPRVRQAVAALMGTLAEKYRVAIFYDLKPLVIDSIEKNFVRSEKDQAEDLKKTEAATSSSEGSNLSALTSTDPAPFKHTSLVHDTEGWKCLETSFVCLQKLAEGCGLAFRDALSDDLINLVIRAGRHPNRFVRESGYHTLNAMSKAADVQTLYNVRMLVAEAVAAGLKDNWSQVRFSACTAARSFLLRSPEEGDKLSYKTDVFPLLLPRLCLNRHYVAEGVKIYSHDTWKQLFPGGGAPWIVKYMKETVEYYVEQSDADNHAVREASCQAMAELANKVDTCAVGPYAKSILHALVVAFYDASWPVRDCAARACGDLAVAFPDVVKEKRDELFDLYFNALWDCIWSVRETAAVALGKMIDAYGDEVMPRITELLKERLPKVKEQSADSVRYTGVENVTQFGVAAKKARDNDPELHTGQQMYSCGSLAPKLKKGSARAAGCCSGAGIESQMQPWEASDGCVYLLREVASRKPDVAVEFMDTLLDVAGLTNFGHFGNFLETIWKQMASIAKSLGKARMQPFAGEVIRRLVMALECGNRLAAAAAQDSIKPLRKAIGPMTWDAELLPGWSDILARPVF
eukprot:Rmarinus@m.11081